MILPLLVLGIASLMFLYEKSRPGRNWPEVSTWWLRAITLNIVQMATVYVAGLSWDSAMLKWKHDTLAGLDSFWGGITGYLVITFIFYWWHRWRHESDFLWRWLHQLHHSPQRLEIATAFYKHPFEFVADSVICSAILYMLLGLTPESAANAVLLSGIAELFYHWNIKTPHWLGYIFQRPESHCVHHQHGLHAYNYSDLPLWDILFGTFKNPIEWNEQCGLGQEENRFLEMLLGYDVTINKIPRIFSFKNGVQAAGTCCLLILSVFQMSGDLFNQSWMKGLGAALGSSPAPKVFSTIDGLETFSSRFLLSWHDMDGYVHQIELTPEIGGRLQGPYNRCNVYGAVLSYGPILEKNEALHEAYEAVLDYAFAKGNLLKELGLDFNSISGEMTIEVISKGGFEMPPRHFVKTLTLVK